MRWDKKGFIQLDKFWEKDIKMDIKDIEENKNKPCNCQHCRDKSSLIGDMIITKEGPNTEENRDKTHITILQNNINELKKLIEDLRERNTELLEENRSLKSKDILNQIKDLRVEIDNFENGLANGKR